MLTHKPHAIPPSQMTDLRDKLSRIEKDVKRLKAGKDEKQEAVEKRWAVPVKSPFHSL